MIRIILNLGDARCTDPTLWHIDDTLHCQIIPAVVDRLQIRQDILDLPPRIEVHAAYHIVRNVQRDKALFQKTRLRICPVEHCTIPVITHKLALFAFNITRYIFGFFICRIESPEMDTVSRSPVCPERFRLSPGIVCDHCIGSIQNILGGAVILLQLDH